MKKIKHIMTLAAFAVVAFTLIKSASGVPSHTLPITVSGYTGEAPLENFPVLVRLSEEISGFDYDLCAADGRDVAFAIEDGTRLSHEIESWDTRGESLIWVRLPSLTQNIKIICTFGDSAALSVPSSQTDGSVWLPAGYVGVWHMDEENGSVRDSAGHGLDADPKGDASTISKAVVGAIGNARQTGASTKGYLSIPSYEDFGVGGEKVGSSFTVSGFVKLDKVEANKYPRLFSRKNSFTDTNGWEMEMAAASDKNFSARGAAQDSGASGTFPHSLLGGWSHVALVYNERALAVYQNGSLVKMATITAAKDNQLPMSIGCDSDGDESYAIGSFDECRLIDAVVSADWLLAEYKQASSEFLSYGAVESAFNASSFIVWSLPEEYGSPTPAYGNNTCDAGSVTVSMDTLKIEETGRTIVLKGWNLYSVDLETNEKTLISSYTLTAAEAAASSYSSLVTHQPPQGSYTEFEWVWHVLAEASVSTPEVLSAGVNTINLKTVVGGLGSSAETAELAIVYGFSPETMVYRKSLTIHAPMAYETMLRGLTPGSAYYVKAQLVIPNEETRETATVRVETKPYQRSSYSDVAGLWQTYFPNANKEWERDILSLPVGVDWRNYQDDNRIRRRELTTIAAYSKEKEENSYTSEIWGDQVLWPIEDYGQFAYAGYIFLDAAKTYKFRTRIDDNEYVAITDAKSGITKVLINDTGNGNGIYTSSSYSPGVTGWHKIEIRFSDATQGKGAYPDPSTGKFYFDQNMGYSDDNGTTWKLFVDPGDGSFLRTELTGYAVAEKIENGTLAGFTLTFDAAREARTLYMVYGSQPGGDNPDRWESWTGADLVAGTIPADVSDYTVQVPEGWGTDEKCVLGFYFKEGEKGALRWFDVVFHRDYSVPIIKDVALDGVGGDTLSVSGNLVSFGGETCTLFAYVGRTETDLKKWQGTIDGSVLSARGDFSFKLFESDPNSEFYLAAGETYYFQLEALSGGGVSRTEILPVTMSAKAAFSSSLSYAANQRVITFTGLMSQLGMNTNTVVSLYVGAENNENALQQVGDSVRVTSFDTFTFTHTFEGWDEVEYYWQFRAVNETEGKSRTLTVSSPLAKVTTKDTATYTWKPTVASGNWDDAANWTADKEDNRGYPRSSGANASFEENTTAQVFFGAAKSINNLNLKKANIDITFVRPENMTTDETKLKVASISELNKFDDKVNVAFDGVAVEVTNKIEIGPQTTYTIANNANFYIREKIGVGQGVLNVIEDSYFRCTEIYIGKGSILLRDSTIDVATYSRPAQSADGATIRFEGTSSLWRGGKRFSTFATNAKINLDFVIPVGGYQQTPIQDFSVADSLFGNDASDTKYPPLTINVLDESPANLERGVTHQELISWSKGINKAKITAGNLPKYKGKESDDAFFWGEGETPTTFGVTINGNLKKGMMIILK